MKSLANSCIHISLEINGLEPMYSRPFSSPKTITTIIKWKENVKHYLKRVERR